MKILAGPANDKREIDITLPENKKRIGVMLSGGADSAILLYLLALERKMSNSTQELVPLTVPRDDGAWDYVKPIVDKVNALLDINLPDPVQVGNPTLHHSEQTHSGERDGRTKYGVDHIFYGSQQHPPVPMPGEYPARPDRIEYLNNKGEVATTCPFAFIDKRHTLDLYDIFQVWPLIEITHSCTAMTKGRCGECYNCKERQWALDDLGFTDPGLM
jgi:hypothetical protein